MLVIKRYAAADAATAMATSFIEIRKVEGIYLIDYERSMMSSRMFQGYVDGIYYKRLLSFGSWLS